MNQRKALDLKTALAVMWLIFTVALAVWLFVFHAQLFGDIEELGTPEAQELVQHSRMVAYELGTLIFALLIGGAGLLYLIWLERKRTDQIQRFFAVFTHELRTSISRLRLQAESVQGDLLKAGRGGPALRLLDDMGKLEVQLENSLWVARGEEDRFLIETIPLSRILSEFAPQFPLLVHLSREAFLRADRRALESIFKNVFQNAVVHGEAQNLWIEVVEQAPVLRLSLRDDGKGFQGEKKNLGALFLRHGRSSGTGLGLYLIRRLARLLGGEARFVPLTQGFQIELELPGSLAAAEPRPPEARS